MRGQPTTFVGSRFHGTPLRERPRPRWTILLLASCLALPLTVVSGPAVARKAADIAAGVDIVAPVGQRMSFTKEHIVSHIPGRLQLAAAFDSSQSFENDLPEIIERFPGLVERLSARASVQVAVASFIDDPRYGGHDRNHPYRLLTPGFTAESAVARDALRTIRPMDSKDEPETWATAVDRMVEDLAWDTEPQVTRVLVLATDASSKHRDDGFSGSPAPTPDDLILRLRQLNIRVIALLPSDHHAPDAARLARRTGGSVQWISRDSSNLDAAITAGLKDIPVVLSPKLTGATCPATDVSVEPQRTRPLTAGTRVRITVALTVPDHVPLGIYECTLRTGDVAAHTVRFRVAAAPRGTDRT